MANYIAQLLGHFVFYTLATLGLIRCIALGLIYGHPPLSHAEKNNLAKARQQFWDLSQQPIPGFNHAFLTLRNGKKLHYIHNNKAIATPKNLLIFFHGFPDSSLMWRGLLLHRDQAVTRDNLIVSVDLPGYGGSDSLATYDTDVLEALAEFCIGIRKRHLKDSLKVIVVAHDWGCNLATRLAMETPLVADQFVLINGLFVDLAMTNFNRHIRSLPGLLFHLRFSDICKESAILLRQVWCLAYVFTFDLSERVLGYILGTWNEMAVLRALIKMANIRNSDFNFTEALAASLGTGGREAQKMTSETAESYGDSAQIRAMSPATLLWNMTGLYRNGVLRGTWTKSKELLASLREIEAETANLKAQLQPSRVDYSAGADAESVRRRLRAPATIVWGLDDHVMFREICLDGLHSYLAPQSEVITLPRSGHWVPVEAEGIEVILTVLEHHTAEKQNGRIGEKMLDERYRGARLASRT